MTYDEAFGGVAATDEDWSSPTFDHLQPYIAVLIDGSNGYTSAEREAQAERWREGRPYLIAHLRRAIGDPRWDPRGGRVLPMISEAGR